MTKKGYAIQLDAETAEALRFLAEKTGRTQINVVRELLNNMMQLAGSYEDPFNYLVQQKDFHEIIVTFIGKSKMLNGKMVLPNLSNVGEKKLKNEIKKLAKKETKKA